MVYASRGMCRRREIHSPPRAWPEISFDFGFWESSRGRGRGRGVVTIPIKPTSLGDPLARSIRSRPSTTTSFFRCLPRIIYEDVSKRRPGRLFPSPHPLSPNVPPIALSARVTPARSIRGRLHRIGNDPARCRFKATHAPGVPRVPLGALRVWA